MAGLKVSISYGVSSFRGLENYTVPGAFGYHSNNREKPVQRGEHRKEKRNKIIKKSC